MKSGKANLSKIALKNDGVIQFGPTKNAIIFKDFYYDLAGNLVRKLPVPFNTFNNNLMKQYYMNIEKSCHNFELYNATLEHQGLRLNFVECKSFIELNSTDILALCETNLGDSIDSGYFSVTYYLPLIQKDSTTHAWFCSLCKQRASFCTRLISRKLQILTCVFWLALLHSVSYFFFLYRSPSWSLCTIFYSISSNIDEVLSINPC